MEGSQVASEVASKLEIQGEEFRKAILNKYSSEEK